MQQLLRHQLIKLTMTGHIRSCILLLSLLLWPGVGSTGGNVWAQPQGEVYVTPTRGTAGDFGTWTVTYRLGSNGIAEGGGVRVQLPDEWHAGARNSAHPLQATDPTADHYVSARTSRGEVKLETTVESESDDVLVKSRRRGLDGRSERYVFVVRVQVAEGSLEEGDSLSIVYGDTSHGSRGMRAAPVSTGPQAILMTVDDEGSGTYEPHPDRPTLESISGPPAELKISGPSNLVMGRAADLDLAITDGHFNPVDDFQGRVAFDVIQGEVEIASEVQLDLTNGAETISFTPTEEGILRIKASALGGILEDTSNPMKVEQEEPQRKVYWGDLHSHSHYSHDGVGRNSFEYARLISRLDFYALTDHSIPPSDGHTHGLAHHVWDEYTSLPEEHYQPGAFVTLHAYEASFGSPYGHHNVFFRGEPGPLLVPDNYDGPDSVTVSLPEMWERLRAGEALTIPHHTGKMPNPVRWDPHDPEFRRNFEIYSAHGLSEAYDPDHPLAFEQSDFTSPSRSVDGPQFAQDAWIHGLTLSTIAASDDHRAQPGKAHEGLAAVKSTGLTRSEIFDGLYQRRTYGTTGARILLDFSVNGEPMGQQVTVDKPPLLEIEAHGTEEIDHVEVLRYSRSKGGFEVVHIIRPDALDFTWSRVDREVREDAIYYVRLRQVGHVGGRVAMAWSSPIWVQVSDDYDRGR